MEDQQLILENNPDLQNLYIEPHLGGDILMSIDQTKFAEDVVTILSFLVIILCGIFSGFFGPKPSVSEFVSEQFDTVNRTNSPKYLYSLNNLSHLSSSIEIKLEMERKKDVHPSKGSVTLIIEGANYLIPGRLETYVFNPLPVEFKGEETKSQQFSIFVDRAVKYNTLALQLAFDDVFDEYEGVKTVFIICNTEFTTYQMIFRILFAVSHLSFVSLFVFRLKNIKFSFWHLEQKLTVALLLVTTLYNNPLFGFNAFEWKDAFKIDSLLSGLVVGFTFYFLLVLFDSLRSKSAVYDFYFFLPKFIISFFTGLIVATHSFMNVSLKILAVVHSPAYQGFYRFLDILVLPSAVIATGYVIYLIGIAFRDVDETERFKLSLYVIIVSICALSGLLGWALRFDNSLTFTVRYSIISLFAILMSYFHWPYEMKQDLVYEDQEHGAEKAAGGSFFVNEDSGN